uniref:Uncharacterized protein n=1 Tax=Heliothis virescens TaxID=7102 RepID=A0A2A4J993_HELVI
MHGNGGSSGSRGRGPGRRRAHVPALPRTRTAKAYTRALRKGPLYLHRNTGTARRARFAARAGLRSDALWLAADWSEAAPAASTRASRSRAAPRAAAPPAPSSSRSASRAVLYVIIQNSCPQYTSNTKCL